MAVRTTASAVETILKDEFETGDDLTTDIEWAASIVDGYLVGEITDSDRLEVIERYLSAHSYYILKNPVESEGVKGVSQKLSSNVDLGFNASYWGQHALRLDTTGILSRVNKGKAGAASIWFLGRTTTTSPA